MATDFEIIAHVVEDPAAWIAHARVTVGEHAVQAKVARYRAEAEQAMARPGYQTRAEREALGRSEATSERAARKSARLAKQSDADAALDARIAAEVTRQLAAR